jgi:hypothetical protein
MMTILTMMAAIINLNNFGKGLMVRLGSTAELNRQEDPLVLEVRNQ